MAAIADMISEVLLDIKNVDTVAEGAPTCARTDCKISLAVLRSAAICSTLPVDNFRFEAVHCLDVNRSAAGLAISLAMTACLTAAT